MAIPTESPANVGAEISPSTPFAHDPNYVIVNTSNPFFIDATTASYPVLPGEEPRTFGRLEDLVEDLANLINEYDHVLGETLQVYQLQPIPVELLSAKIDAALENLETMWVKVKEDYG